MKHVKWSNKLEKFVARVSVRVGDWLDRDVYAYYDKSELAEAWAAVQRAAFKADPEGQIVMEDEMTALHGVVTGK